MRTVQIRVESMDAGLERFKQAWSSGEKKGEYLTFQSVEGMQNKLTPSRWHLLHVLQEEGPMGIRALARRLDRDIKNVHTDVAVLKELGLIEQTREGVWVPYDEIRAEFTVKRSAA